MRHADCLGHGDADAVNGAPCHIQLGTPGRLCSISQHVGSRLHYPEWSVIPEKSMSVIGPLLFGAVTVVNLIVFTLVLGSLFRRTRVHH